VGRRRPPPGLLGVMDRAVRCYAKSSSFAVGLERALATRGANRPVVCAVYGALAGAHYGEDCIPEDWRGRVEGLERVGRLAEELFRTASANAPAVA
jgi:ADP-ribosylglycohydrolase